MQTKTAIYFLKFNQIKSLGYHGIDSLVSTGKQRSSQQLIYFLKAFCLMKRFVILIDVKFSFGKGAVAFINTLLMACLHAVMFLL